MTATVPEQPAPRSANRLRRYPSLIGAVPALIACVLLLPSALSLPQTNPTETLEYAPVPPSEDEPPPPAGNFSSLSLGSSGTVGSGEGEGEGFGGLPPAVTPPGAGANPRQKPCVGNPPRQTEDPMSPPCVAFFDGDNGGATFRGVSKDEIRVLIYRDPARNVTETGSDPEPDDKGKYFDLNNPEHAAKYGSTREYTRFQRYFNYHYQTYNRFVHFYLYLSHCSAEDSIPCSPEMRRADAADNQAKIKPFAVLANDVIHESGPAYIEAMAAAGSMVFGIPRSGMPEAFYRQYPGRIWSYYGSVERRAALYTDYVCTQVVGRPVADSGNVGENGDPRQLGLLYTTDPTRPDLQLMAKLIRSGVQKCGGRIIAEGTYPRTGYASSTPEEFQTAGQDMATFQQRGVTTVLWTGGFETAHSQVAGQLKYYPEWIVNGEEGGVGTVEDASFGMDASAWAHAWLVSQVAVRPPVEDQQCMKAQREVDPEAGPYDVGWGCLSHVYEDIRQLFTGIQLAGPRLTAKTMDRGFHAIPPRPSSTPMIPACFYDPSDYTCVKDAAVGKYDPSGTATVGYGVGCWRMVNRGKRSLLGAFPRANITTGARPDDPCY